MPRVVRVTDPVNLIRNQLTLIQFWPIAISALVMPRCKTGIGNKSLTIANGTIGKNPIMVLTVRPVIKVAPRSFRRNAFNVFWSVCKELYFNLNRATVIA